LQYLGYVVKNPVRINFSVIYFAESAMRSKLPKIPKARNNPARTSLSNYFERISNSLEDRIPEFLQMKKYARVYEESQKLLEIEKTIDIAAGSIYEINIDDKKLISNQLVQFSQLLNKKSKTIRHATQGKAFSKQIQILHNANQHIQNIISNTVKITRHINRINEIIPVIKALLKMKEQEDYESTPVLVAISDALKRNLHEPSMDEIKVEMQHENVLLSKYDSHLHFEHLNDASDKLIGLLNDKLLLMIGISENLIAGVEDDGINDVDANQRLPDELMVLFLISSILDIFHRVREIRNCVKRISSSIKAFGKIMQIVQKDLKLRSLLHDGENSAYEIISKHIPSHLKRIMPAINEIATNLDALDLKLKLNTLDLDKVIRITNGLIYEKANRIWENPYDF
jgi:transcription termination factor NusB